MRRKIRRYILLVAIALLSFSIFCLWPWIASLPKKFGPLANYRVYEYGKRVDGSLEPGMSGWREPSSRWELLVRRDSDILFDRKLINRLARQNKTPPKPQVPYTQMQMLRGDQLHDFVIDRGDSYGYPDSEEQLEQSISRGEAQRASAFFTSHFANTKPFFGEVPPSICYRENVLDYGGQRVNELQIRKNFEPIQVYFDTPKQPQVSIVAGGSIYGAKQAYYERKPPVAFDYEQYWAVVYAGVTHTLLDRITIGRTATDILLNQPKDFRESREMYPYWFIIPLGKLPAGSYTANVRIANSNNTIATVTSNLRPAIKKEIDDRNRENAEFMAGSERHFENKKMVERANGSALQVSLERLAEFVHAADISTDDRELLSRDVAQLGEAVDWNKGIYETPRHPRYVLAPPTPGKKPEKRVFLPGELEAGSPEWEPSDIKLSDVWLCDGTDAQWYAANTYRKLPEFDSALSVDKPSAVQDKIRQIWKTLKDRSHQRNSGMPSLPAKGTINEVIDAAFETIVYGAAPLRDFKPDDQIWAVFTAKQSFLIREIKTRSYTDKFSGATRTEFLVYVSAYIAEADGVKEDATAPATFALIPLGKCESDTVGVMFNCMSICGRESGSGEPKLLDAQPSDFLMNEYRSYLSPPTGFRVSK